MLGIIQNRYIYIPFLLWFFCQTFKLLFDLIINRKFDFKRLIGAGGMPSSHSAIVTSITTMLGRYEGVNSSIFAVSLIFSLIVMYDACGVRRAAGKQAQLLNKIIETPGLTGVEVSERLIEVLGHTPVQVFVGAGIGIIVGLIV
ncbi:MAG: divergent PAP2 family protein [Clostridia bacterium]|nr:divergent PAP2 family protein [Clostridia bacterium]